MLDLYITSRLLIDMGKKMKPGELCSYTLLHKPTNELMWCIEHNSSKARWGPAVFLVGHHECW